MGLLKEFAIQLYSMRKETETNFKEVLERIGQTGYTGVEFAGYRDIEAKEMRKMLDANGLKSVGSHVGMENLRNSLSAELEYNTVIGSEYIICPYAGFESEGDVKKAAEEFDVIGEKCAKAGFKFAYHNHAHEFEKVGDQYKLDLLFQNVNRKNCVMELDLYWAAYAGVDYMEYLDKNAGIIKLLHIKQIRDFESKECVDLDEGVIDFKPIIQKALASGVEHFVLEQEAFAVGPYVSIKKGFDYIMSL